MKRLYFTLPRKPLSSNHRAKNVSGQPCTFEELANLIDPEPDTSTVWKKAVDRENKALLFYQLDLGEEVPKFAKCLYIKAEEFRLKNHSEHRLVPSAFLDETITPTDDGTVPMMLPVAPNVSSIMDVVKLLQYIELFPETPDDEEANSAVEDETPDVEPDRIGVSSLRKNAVTSSACEEERFPEHPGDVIDSVEDDVEAGDNTDCDSEYAPSAASAEDIPAKKSVKHKATKIVEPPALNDSQLAYAKMVKQSLQKPGPGKEELYPGANIYAPSRLLQQVQRKYLQNTPKRGRARVEVTSKLPGAHLAITLMDSLGKFTNMLPIDRKTLKEIFDNDFLTKIAKFVNLHHGDVLNGRRLPLSPDQMIGPIQTRLRYYLRRDQMVGKETEYMMKKRLNLLPPWKQKRSVAAKDSAPADIKSQHMASLIPSATDIQWNPRLPYNHPDFRPSYLFHRPDYVPFWPPGDNPPVYIKKQDLEYFCSEQSHSDYPENSRWIRAVMYKIFDEQAMLHMCYIHWRKQKEHHGSRHIISTHSLLSPGFAKMFDEFMRYTGRLTEDVEFLMRTLQYWFKDYKKTIMKRKVLTDDPTAVKVNLGKMMGENVRGKRKR